MITLSDIDAVKRSGDFANAIVQTIREPLLVLDSKFRVRTANQSFYQTFMVSPLDTEGKSIYSLGDGQWNIPQLRALLVKALSTTSALNDIEVRHTFPSLGPRTMLLNARRVAPGNDEPELILLAIEDVTLRKEAEEILSKTANQLLNSEFGAGTVRLCCVS